MSEKISDTVKITLALQNVRGDLVQSLNVSVSESTTWSQAHDLLINHFNNAAPLENKIVYQFTNPDKKRWDQLCQEGKGKGQKSKGPQKRSKGSSNNAQQQKGKSKGKGETKPKGKGQWTTWSRSQNQTQKWSQSQGDQKGQRGKSGNGKAHCQACGKSGHQAHQCWDSAIISELKASSQHLGVSSGLTNWDSRTRSASRFQDLRPAAQQLQQRSQSQASTHYGSVPSVLSHSNSVVIDSTWMTSLNPQTQAQRSKRLVLHFLTP